MMLPRVPSATYRIQFHLGFRFVDARELIPYLHDLGVTELYASPRFKARRGSSHGYDVADPMRVNSELGTEREFEELVKRLRHYGMGLLLDIVPNHMSASTDNPWWLDVLENGASSAYARFFDIRWAAAASPAAALRKGRVLLPLLGDLYGNVLENQELTLKLDETGFFVRYYDSRLPLDPKTYKPILEIALSNLSASSRTARTELGRLLARTNQLPPRTVRNPVELGRRRTEKEALKSDLWRLYHGRPQVRAALDNTLLTFNGAKGDPSSFNQLDGLIGQQAYRPAFWKLAAEEINYRRFFDVSDLVGVRVEDPEVFEARHAQIFQLIREGKVTGLRIDHVDGLRDPLGYLRKLQKAACGASTARSARASFYIVVEKIQAEAEDLPQEWPVAGTTGYDFLNLVNGVFVDPEGLRSLGEIYRRFTTIGEPFAEFSYRGNRQVLEQLFNGEVNSLTHALVRLAERDRYARDIPLPEHKRALVEVTACLPVYRTYIHDESVSEHDRRFLRQAIDEARRRTPADQAGPPAFDFLRRVLMLEPDGLDAVGLQERLEFVMDWQQFTGAAMAKGLEDTALYNYNRLISLNEVGGQPGGAAKSVDELHEALRLRFERMPFTLNASSTHDTKRSEDVRARLDALSELHAEWGRCLRKWRRLNRPRKAVSGSNSIPDANEEMLIYQTLLGVWPLAAEDPSALRERLAQFIIKALREAKVHTSWLRPDEAYEAAVASFVDSLIALPADDPFMKDFLALANRIAFYGAFNSLSALAIKIMTPGVPDFYQGTELWDFSLVDPDNRRPVDFSRRVHALEELRRRQAGEPLELVRELVSSWQDGRIKLYLVYKSLEFRRVNPAVFSAGDYLPLEVRGPRSRNVIAFARLAGKEWAVVAVPRLLAQIARPPAPPVGSPVWGSGTMLRLPQGAPNRWVNVLTGESVSVLRSRGTRSLHLCDLFSNFPVAVLAARE